MRKPKHKRKHAEAGTLLTYEAQPGLDRGLGSRKARLGFFLTTRPGQGALHLSCRGCECMGLTSKFAKKFNPFPTVQTDALLLKR